MNHKRQQNLQEQTGSVSANSMLKGVFSRVAKKMLLTTLSITALTACESSEDLARKSGLIGELIERSQEKCVGAKVNKEDLKNLLDTLNFETLHVLVEKEVTTCLDSRLQQQNYISQYDFVYAAYYGEQKIVSLYPANHEGFYRQHGRSLLKQFALSAETGGLDLSAKFMAATEYELCAGKCTFVGWNSVGSFEAYNINPAIKYPPLKAARPFTH